MTRRPCGFRIAPGLGSRGISAAEAGALEERDQIRNEMAGQKVEQTADQVERAPTAPTPLQSFHADRDAEYWVAGEPARPNESVTKAIKQFSPRSVPDGVWCRVEELVRSSVRQAEPTSVYSAKALLSVVTQLVIWIDRLGLPLEPDVVFHPDNIDRFASEACAHLASGTQHNYRTQLRSVGAAVLGPELFPPHRCP